MGIASKCLKLASAIYGFIVVDLIAGFVFVLLNLRRGKTVSNVESNILLMSATELAKKIRSSELTCSEVIEAYIQRILQVNPVINAVVADRFDEARVEARRVDEILDTENIPEEYSMENAPFLGVPVSAKEAFAIAGLPNCSGLVSRKNVVASEDAVAVSLMRKAGAVPLAVTNCSELCMWYESSNNVYGTTCNPYNNARIVGGSSGGEGALLGSAGSVIGIGSDIGGSIRMPCFFNGIFGHKPTTGIVNNDGQFPNAQGGQKEFLVTGPMCRYACDLMPMFKVLAADNVSKLKLDEKVDLRKLKFYSMEDDGGSVLVSGVDQELKQSQERVIEHFESTLGIKVERLAIQELKLSAELWMAKVSTQDDAPTFGSLMGDGQEVNATWELLKWLVHCSDHTLPAIGLAIGEKFAHLTRSHNLELVAMCDKLKIKMQSLLDNDAVLLYPSHPKIAPYHHQPLFMLFNWAYTGIFNVLGFPATQCPTGLSTRGLPLGLQVVSGRYNDHLTIAVAQEIEQACGGWVCPGS